MNVKCSGRAIWGYTETKGHPAIAALMGSYAVGFPVALCKSCGSRLPELLPALRAGQTALRFTTAKAKRRIEERIDH